MVLCPEGGTALWNSGDAAGKLSAVSSRQAVLVAIATLLVTSVASVLVLGNAFQSKTCAPGWTGYAPIGTCVKTFWTGAFFVGPAIGLLLSANLVLIRRRTAR